MTTVKLLTILILWTNVALAKSELPLPDLQSRGIDVDEFYDDTKTFLALLQQHYDDEKYHYVFFGRSFGNLIGMLNLINPNLASSIPFSHPAMAPDTDPENAGVLDVNAIWSAQKNDILRVFRQFINFDEIRRKGRVAVIDRVISGKSMKNFLSLFERVLDAEGITAKIYGVGITRERNNKFYTTYGTRMENGLGHSQVILPGGVVIEQVLMAQHFRTMFETLAGENGSGSLNVYPPYGAFDPSGTWADLIGETEIRPAHLGMRKFFWGKMAGERQGYWTDQYKRLNCPLIF